MLLTVGLMRLGVILARCLLLSDIGLVPLLCHFLFPVGFLLDLLDTVLDDCERLSHFKVFHVFLVVKFVREFKQIVDFRLFVVFLLLFGVGPCRSRLGTLLRLLGWGSQGGSRLNTLEVGFRESGGLFKGSSRVVGLLEVFDFVTLGGRLVLELLYLKIFHLLLEHNFFALHVLLGFKVLQEVTMSRKNAVGVLYWQ